MYNLHYKFWAQSYIRLFSVSVSRSLHCFVDGDHVETLPISSTRQSGDSQIMKEMCKCVCEWMMVLCKSSITRRRHEPLRNDDTTKRKSPYEIAKQHTRSIHLFIRFSVHNRHLDSVSLFGYSWNWVFIISTRYVAAHSTENHMRVQLRNEYQHM